jgi:hypothetical protein
MQWRRDYTRRFLQYPHYEKYELDLECTALVRQFVETRHGGVMEYPVSTDDLTLLIESLAEDLDWAADLSGYGPQVEGLTEFRPGKKPLVKLAAHLNVPNMRRRFRMTLAHELAHVKFHDCLYQLEDRSAMRFLGETVAPPQYCKRDAVSGRSVGDWMEWQAGYVGGSILMPIDALRSIAPTEQLAANSVAEKALCEKVSSTFDVSTAAARVRLSQTGLITDARQLKFHDEDSSLTRNDR